MQLVLIDYEYRDVLEPLVEYIHQVNRVEFPHQLITVVIPEFVPTSLGGQLLHNQTANFLRFRLRGEEDIVVIDVPYLIKKGGTTPPIPVEHASTAIPATPSSPVSNGEAEAQGVPVPTSR